ncbi:unnamed protein product [Heterosigma akashiwo]
MMMNHRLNLLEHSCHEEGISISFSRQLGNLSARLWSSSLDTVKYTAEIKKEGSRLEMFCMDNRVAVIPGQTGIVCKTTNINTYLLCILANEVYFYLKKKN